MGLVCWLVPVNNKRWSGLNVKERSVTPRVECSIAVITVGEQRAGRAALASVQDQPFALYLQSVSKSASSLPVSGMGPRHPECSPSQSISWRIPAKGPCASQPAPGLTPLYNHAGQVGTKDQDQGCQPHLSSDPSSHSQPHLSGDSASKPSAQSVLHTRDNPHLLTPTPSEH